MRNRTFDIWLLLSLVACACAGCSFGQPAPQGRQFLLQAGPTDPSPQHPTPSGSIVVSAARVVPPFGERAFVYRIGADEYKADPYNGFLAAPSLMVTNETIEWLRGNAVFGTVCGEGVVCDARYRLQHVVESLCAEFVPGTSQAVVRIRYFVTDQDRSPQAVVLDREYERAAGLADGRPETVAAGFNDAFRLVLRAVSDDLRALPSSAQ